MSVLAVVFVVQNLFDEAQITADNVGPPMRRDQWQYIHDLGLDMKHTLSNVSYADRINLHLWYWIHLFKIIILIIFNIIDLHVIGYL